MLLVRRVDHELDDGALRTAVVHTEYPWLEGHEAPVRLQRHKELRQGAADNRGGEACEPCTNWDKGGDSSPRNQSQWALRHREATHPCDEGLLPFEDLSMSSPDSEPGRKRGAP